MNQKNQVRCPHCQKMCTPRKTKAPEFSRHARWHMCVPCNAFFAVGPACRLQGAKYTIPDPKNERNAYQMVVNYKKNKTHINYYEERESRFQVSFSGGPLILSPGTTVVDSSGHTWTVSESHKELYFSNILTLDKAVKDVTPENVLDKIKMYILFS